MAFVVLLALAQPEPAKVLWKVGGLDREALVVLPAKGADGSPPLVFDFHGHGGTAAHAARKHALHRHWPEAIVAYPQGVPTPGRLTDPEGKRNGWQHRAGDHDDRDLKLFDAMLADLVAKRGADRKRVYCTGHSNGGGFTYLLWSARPGTFAAIAPVAAGGAALVATAKPCPVLHVAGENDPLVKFAGQKRTMDAVRKLNACAETGTPWAPECTLYASSAGAPFVAFIHPGGHEYPAAAAERIVRFFKDFKERRPD